METIKWKILDDVGYLTLNSPPSNMMDDLFFAEFSDWISMFNGDNKIKGVVISGMGRHFSAGSDIDNLIDKVKLNGNNGSASDYFVRNSLVFSRLSTLPFPVIAAITGVCIGSAFELALGCDIRICGEKAIIGLPETSFDLMPGCGGTQILPKLISYSKAIEMILTGQNYTPAQLKELGIVDKIVPNKEILFAAKRCIHEINLDLFKELKMSIQENQIKHE